MADVLARRDRPGDDDRAPALRRVFGRHHRIRALRHGCTRHDANGACQPRRHRRTAGRAALGRARETQWVVIACPRGLCATERITVHRGAIESGHVERCDHVAREHAAARVLEAHDLLTEPRRVRIDPSEGDVHFAPLAEPAHPHVAHRQSFTMHRSPGEPRSTHDSSVGTAGPGGRGCRRRTDRTSGICQRYINRYITPPRPLSLGNMRLLRTLLGCWPSAPSSRCSRRLSWPLTSRSSRRRA